MRTRAALLSAAWLASAVSTAAAQAATPPECITLEDFARAKVGEFPADWKPRKDAARDAYHVLEEQGIRFLHAASKRLGIQAAKQVEWDLGAYPVLAWSWRPREFPSGADERDSGTNDSALAVYLLVPYSRITGPKAVKYIWSEKVPVGTHLASNYGLTQVLVLRSGHQSKDEWVATIQKMMMVGAQGTEEQFTAVLEYLSKNFGPAAPHINVNRATAAELESGLGLSAKEAAAVVK